MGEAPQFRTTMSFAYGVALEMAPGVVRLVAHNPGPFTFKGTNTYLVGDSDVVLIDPGPEDSAHLEAILATLGDRRLSHILITHTHRDHVDGLAALAAATGAKTAGYGRRAITPGAKRTSASGSEYVDQSFVPDVRLAHGDRLAGEGWALTALHTPGHAPGAVCLYAPDLGCVFTGDTLFHGGPGATGRSFSDGDLIVESIRARLFALPGETVVHTGHGEDTTIGAERAAEWNLG